MLGPDANHHLKKYCRLGVINSKQGNGTISAPRRPNFISRAIVPADYNITPPRRLGKDLFEILWVLPGDPDTYIPIRRDATTDSSFSMIGSLVRKNCKDAAPSVTGLRPLVRPVAGNP